MKALIACEFSGQIRSRARAKGIDAWSCDLLSSDDDSPYHIQGYVDALLEQPWDIVIAHPPCTYLSNSGVRWLYKNGEKDLERWQLMKDAAYFFVDCLLANTPRVAVENPVMHGHGRKIIEDHLPDWFNVDFFSVQPWMFGDNYKKRTCFWTKGLPPLKPTSDLDGKDAIAEVHLASPGEDRWKIRSRTYDGIAQAIVDQWMAYD